jgi:hypothetical protein
MWSPVKGPPPVGSGLACKYQTRVKVNGSDKQSSLVLMAEKSLFVHVPDFPDF